MSTIPDTARWYAKNGIPIFPLRPGTKKPLTDHGFKDATSDPQQIEQWWKENRDANIGIPMGAVSRLLLLDLDYRGKSVVADRDDVIRQFGPLPETCEVITGSGGRHIYFHFDGGKVPKQIAPGVELKADGGYAVAPPSIHPNGQRYTFDGEDGAKALLSVAAPPAWLLNIICAGNAGANQKNAAAAGTTWGEGERNNRLTSVAGKLRRTSLSVEAITAALLEENRMHCEPPWRKQRCAASRSLFAATRQHPQQHSTRLFHSIDSRRHWICSMGLRCLWVASSFIASNGAAR